MAQTEAIQGGPGIKQGQDMAAHRGVLRDVPIKFLRRGIAEGTNELSILVPLSSLIAFLKIHFVPLSALPA